MATEPPASDGWLLRAWRRCALSGACAPLLVLGIGLAVVATHTLATGRWVAPLWGFHSYAFFPPVVLGAAIVALLVAMWGIAVGREPNSPIPGVPSRYGPMWVWQVALALAAFAVFWLARTRHLFLGDGFMVAESVPTSGDLHNFEPIAAQLQHAIYNLTASWLARAGLTSADVAARTTALGSAFAGAVFALTLVPLARAMTAASSRDGVARADRWTWAGVAALIGAQGFVQLFFGYVENYPWVALAITWHLLTVFAWLNGRATLLPVLISFCAAVCLHLSAVALLPGVAALAAWGLLDPLQRRRTLGDLVSGAVLIALVVTLLRMAGGGYDVFGTLQLIGMLVGNSVGDTAGYLMSSSHLGHFVNEMVLIGPLGLPLFLAGLVALPTLGRWSAARVYVVLLGVSWLVAAWLAGDSNLGYARNWDLLAPAGLVFAVCGTFLGLEAVQQLEPRRRLLALATVISLFHTVPWIAVNASFERSFDRFKTLPLGGGRVESTVGYWYVKQGRLYEAENWLMRSLDANAGNSRAHYLLGQVYMSTGRPARAVAAFSAARVQRPDLEMFRLALIDALVMSDRDAAALAEIDAMLGRDASQPAHWAIRGVILMGLERHDEARAAVVHAVELAPREPTYREILRQLDAPTSYPDVLREHWAALIGI